MNPNNRLVGILAEMESFNVEDNHWRADDLLLEVVGILAMTLHGEAETLAEKIIVAYKDFPKWYA